MHLRTHNVNTAFYHLVSGFHTGEIPTRRSPSRYGDVMMVDEPVTITYERPRERVLFNAARDCNPFFHLYESLWMLAGRDDVAPLAYYNSKMTEFSDNGHTFHGAYGYRWRRYFGYDQLEWIADELRANPTSRRCVLQMWDGGRTHPGTCDADEGTGDLYIATHGGKDVPCNTCCYFMLRPVDGGNVLDLTVLNRSNDLVWGMLGANVVHMSILQEYMAAKIGCSVGRYHQVTNNLHAYTERWTPELWLDEYRAGVSIDRYYTAAALPIDFGDMTKFDAALPEFVEHHKGSEGTAAWYPSPWLNRVASPMMWAYRAHKNREYKLRDDYAERIEADDWRLAAVEWFKRRDAKRGL